MLKNLTIISILAFLTISCPNDQRCGSCQGNKCVVCYDSYLTQKGTCQISQKKVKNCLQYKSEGECKFCYHGFYLSKDSTCEKIKIKNCLELKKDGSCQVCKKGVLVKNGACDESNKCKIPNCDVCSETQNQESCVSCKNGFAISFGFGCQLEQAGSNHCLFLNQYGQCVICDYNHFHQNGKCVKSPVLNIVMDFDGKGQGTGEAEIQESDGFFDKFVDRVKDFFDSGVYGFEVFACFAVLIVL